MSDSMDSFLDLLFNVIGIMVLIVAFAAVASTTTTQVRGIVLAIKKEVKKKQINIVVSGNKAIYLDRDNSKEAAKYFAVRVEQNNLLLTPKENHPGWITFSEAQDPGNRYEEYLKDRPPEEYGISLLIYQDSFVMAARLESTGRLMGYEIRHVFLEEHETMEFRRKRIFGN